MSPHYLSPLLAAFGRGHRRERPRGVGRLGGFKNVLESGYLGKLFAINPRHASIQGQRYLPGQEFKPHNDWFYTTEKYWELERQRGGQRCWTAMAYLNQVEEGGATHFTHVGIEIEPKPGVLLVWNNASPDGTPNVDTMHAGCPVVKGSKYVITKWFRTRQWR